MMDADRDFSRETFAGERDSRRFVDHARSERVFHAASNDNGGQSNGRARTSSSARAVTASDAPDNNGGVHPKDLRDLIDASTAGARDAAWDRFIAGHSRLLLHVARKVMPAPDGAMDAYAHVLERLRRDDCCALRAYVPDGRSLFSTWLVVVARRMCVDYYRQLYGRDRGETPSELALIDREARYRLTNFIGGDQGLAQIADDRTGPDAALRNGQLHAALDQAVSSLPPEDRLLLALRFRDNLPANRIAALLSLRSQFHVYRRLKAVCEALRLCLAQRGVDEAEP